MTCQNCKHANYYAAHWWYPWLDPKCAVHKISIKPDDTCENFELIGRMSR